jgi:hypothetical protein
MVAAPALVTPSTFTLADRLKIQKQRIHDKDYIVLGRLSAVLFEAQRSTVGLSQSLPRYDNPNQPKLVPDAMKPFSEKQTELWQSTTLDWLQPSKGPILARSKDGRDWLLPQGLTALPDLPDPRWMPGHAFAICPKGKAGCSKCIPPRIPQKLVGCPVVGDRVRHKITERNGHVWGILHPVILLSFVANGPDGQGHWAKARGNYSQADGMHPAMLIDDELHAYFVGGTFS